VRLRPAAGAGHAGVTVLTTRRALRGQPLIRPDTLTLGVPAGLVLVVLGAAALVARAGRAATAVPDHRHAGSHR
jgi:hypothetical protein